MQDSGLNLARKLGKNLVTHLGNFLSGLPCMIFPKSCKKLGKNLVTHLGKILSGLPCMILPKFCKKLGKIYVICLGNFLSYIILPKSCMKLGKILALPKCLAILFHFAAIHFLPERHSAMVLLLHGKLNYYPRAPELYERYAVADVYIRSRRLGKHEIASVYIRSPSHCTFSYDT